MNIHKTPLPGVLLLEPRVFRDDRGYFLETWNQIRYAEIGLAKPFVQDNLSFSKRGILRGLHYQHPKAQGKLVSVLQGEVFDVAVDIRIGSPTYGQWFGAILSAENARQLYIPEGFAHGFVVNSDSALFSYKCTEFYQPKEEGSIIWNDPEIGIKWLVDAPRLSPKDAQAPRLQDVPRERLPSFT